jgi:hypothetical protein
VPSIDCKDEIEIDAPIEKVFDVVFDYQNWNQWIPIYSCYHLGQGEIGVGSKVHHQYGYKPLILGDFVRSIDAVSQYEWLEESYIDGGLIGKGVWHFKESDNRTIASFHCIVRSNKLLTHLSFILMGKMAHRSVYGPLLKKLKAHCESFQL